MINVQILTRNSNQNDILSRVRIMRTVTCCHMVKSLKRRATLVRTFCSFNTSCFIVALLLSYIMGDVMWVMTAHHLSLATITPAHPPKHTIINLVTSSLCTVLFSDFRPTTLAQTWRIFVCIYNLYFHHNFLFFQSQYYFM